MPADGLRGRNKPTLLNNQVHPGEDAGQAPEADRGLPCNDRFGALHRGAPSQTQGCCGAARTPQRAEVRVKAVAAGHIEPVAAGLEAVEPVAAGQRSADASPATAEEDPPTRRYPPAPKGGFDHHGAWATDSRRPRGLRRTGAPGSQTRPCCTPAPIAWPNAGDKARRIGSAPGVAGPNAQGPETTPEAWADPWQADRGRSAD